MSQFPAPNNIDTIIRTATPDDYQELFRISLLLHAENGQHPLSIERTKATIWRGCNRDQSIIGVIGPHDNIKAMLILQIQTLDYSDDLRLVEIWNYVRPDARKSDFAKRMLRFAKRCADESGLVLLMGILTNERLTEKERLYERELPKAGTLFRYKPKSMGDVSATKVA